MSYVATRLLETHLVLEKTEAMSSGFGNKIIQKNKRMWHNYGIQYIVHSLYFGVWTTLSLRSSIHHPIHLNGSLSSTCPKNLFLS
jgi:hypothetical protein